MACFAMCCPFAARAAREGRTASAAVPRPRAQGDDHGVSRGEDGYRNSLESTAFPGWKAEEIRLALTQEPLSGRAWRALERVALAMGEREGKNPENDPLVRSVHRRAQSRGDTEGYARGRTEAVAAVLGARGIKVSPAFATDLDLLVGRPVDALMAAALACTNEADFWRHLDDAASPSLAH